MKIFFSMVACIVLTGLLNKSVNAEIKVIAADSSYIMGDNDSKIDARRIATQEAKRKALEIAGTYIESFTEVKNMALTKDEIKAYTAGVVETEIVSEEMKGTADHPEIFIKARCKIDIAVLMNQINSLRKDEDLKEQLEFAVKENESLKKERDNLVSKLSTEKDKSKAEDIRKKLDTVLSKEESTDEINKVLRKNVRDMSQAELDGAEVILKKALKVNPENQRAHALLAVIYKKKGDAAGAGKELREAIKSNPSYPLYHMKLGQFLKDSGKYAEALKEFVFVDRLKPNKPDVLYNIGMTYKATGECKACVYYLKKFLGVIKKDERIPEKMRNDAIKAVKECEDKTKRKQAEKRPYIHR